MRKTIKLAWLADKIRAYNFVYCSCCHEGNFNCKNFEDHLLMLRYWVRNRDPVKSEKTPANL